jgi:adenylate kinase
MKPRTVVVLGKAGSGKGTQIELLQKRLTPHLVIHTGGLFRSLASENTLVARRARDILEQGGLQPSWLATFLWLRELVEKYREEDHLIFDGTPRRLEEAEELEKIMAWLGRADIAAVLIDIPDEEALIRLNKRKRDDDTVSAIHERLEWFRHDVGPVIDYYEKKDQLMRIDGVGSVEEVAERVTKALERT